MSTLRGRPPRGFCLAGGISGSTIAHCSSVRSEGYFFRDWSPCTMCAHSSADEICANYRTNLLFCQAIFPDSLLLKLGARVQEVQERIQISLPSSCPVAPVLRRCVTLLGWGRLTSQAL